MRLKIKDGVLLKAKIYKHDNDVVLPDSVTYVGESAFFKSGKKLKSIVLNDSLQYIEKSAFYGCENLREIKFPSSIKDISEYAFANCESLSDVVIPPLVDVINKGVFHNSGLKNIVFHDNVKKIGVGSFSSCVFLESINLPKLLKIIDNNAFYYCSNLKNIVIPDTVEYINKSAFSLCKSLEKIKLPSLLKKISEDTFSYCGNLKTINIPSSVEVIDKNAFIDCENLKKIVLPKSLKYIGVSSFEKCCSLENVKLEKFVKEIDRFAFKKCINLVNVKLNEGLETIRMEAFAECSSLEKIEIPSTVKFIETNAFFSCNKLKSIKIKNIYNLFEEGIANLSNNFNFYYYNKESKEVVLSKKEITGLVGFEKINVESETLKKSQKVALDILFGKEYYTKYKYVSSILANICKDSKGEFDYNVLYDYKEFYNLQKRIFKDKILVGNNAYYDLFKFAHSIGAFSDNKIDRQRACEFISNGFDKGYFTLDNIHRMFSSLNYRCFNKDIAQFIMNKDNFFEILKLEKESNGFIARVFNCFEDIKEFGRSNRGSQRYRKVTLDMCKEYLSKVNFVGVSDENLDVAIEISKYTRFQRSFDFAKEIREEYMQLKEQNRIDDHILNEEIKGSFDEIEKARKNILEDIKNTLEGLNDISNSRFSYEFLSKYDSRNFTLGKYCSCCAHIDGDGYGIAKASILHPDCQNLIIKDGDGTIVSKATLYINRNYGYGVFNTIQINGRYLTKKDRKKIYENYMLAIHSFVEKYNLNFPSNPIKQVNVGMNFNDLSEEIIKGGNEKSKKILKGINFEGYAGDWQGEQYILYPNKCSNKK